MKTLITLLMCLCSLQFCVGATSASSDNAPPSSTTEPGPIAMIGSGLIFVSLVASSTRKRKAPSYPPMAKQLPKR